MSVRAGVADRPRVPGARTDELGPAVVGWGFGVPDHRYDQAAVAEHLARGLGAKPARRLRAAFRGSRVETRHSVLRDFAPDCTSPELFRGTDPTTAQRMGVYRRYAPVLAERAARSALADAELEASLVTHFVFVTCTGFHSPGPDRVLVDRLGLSPAVHRVQIGFQGCSAGLVGLRTAAEIVRGDVEARVLLVAVELASIHFQSAFDDEDLRAHALFADGAGAAVVASTPRGEGPGRVRLGSARSSLLPDSSEQMTWEIGAHGFLMGLSSRIPESLERGLPAFLTGFDDVASVRHWAIHPGGPAILDRIGTLLELDADALAASRDVLREHGNMSSATILYVLGRIARSGASGPGLALAFGPGLTAEGLRFDV